MNAVEKSNKNETETVKIEANIPSREVMSVSGENLESKWVTMEIFDLAFFDPTFPIVKALVLNFGLSPCIHRAWTVT